MRASYAFFHSSSGRLSDVVGIAVVGLAIVGVAIVGGAGEVVDCVGGEVTGCGAGDAGNWAIDVVDGWVD